ncbi:MULTISPECIES: peptide chain release factor N(5)-glutamine methyltransferase [Streptomycetaceae]|uniref:Release factor glutamine methyltransferase n=1 Tax=Streptantibioticus cattleyicolor (strain ATCC 35852 / DSM 46488 / JCM 4925 / NBRC 14057 / NRRL 8057) TaxID=1003195 RepID=F8JQ79_STREN|nr:peptide chain release factor N(5)-glutamine methyltransferase [Streptantibioticus cattleyicolor]AEW96542.1 methylase [Streptantibioticus cattleyicolor NRRL 8057 = DSM 46488]MYS61041.1 peptide chain release factor N(5)-glutamine methyltransferase [Streptomyces sp. SID5468]CCB76879.1 Protein hemK homolog [Streptantibioticus cattleyicolor NRRL 8057 = DSM 46488]
MQPSPGERPANPRSLLLAEVAQATRRLADAGVPSPRFDAEELAAYVHGVKRGELHTVADADFDARYWEAVARRENREPLQHITGRAFFRFLELKVGPGVFVPRPETESVVGWAIDAVRAMDVAEPLIVDLCTGSGAIALALAQEVPRSRVHAVELDEGALHWTRQNVEGSRVVLHQGDALTALPELNGQVDLVVSNPPYIPLTEWEYVAPEARDHDPQLALFSGEDGLDTIRGIERTAHRLLRPGGLVVVEHADTQGGQVPWIFNEETGWADAADHRDLNNRPRFTTARKALP